jgi:hypothetical protein
MPVWARERRDYATVTRRLAKAVILLGEPLETGKPGW